jgi:hypothetical protein
MVPAMSGLLAALAILFWPGKATGLLLLLSPIIWAFGAVDLNIQQSSPTTESPLSVVAIVSGVATFMYGRCLLSPQKDPVLTWVQRAGILYCLSVLPSVFFAP